MFFFPLICHQVPHRWENSTNIALDKGVKGKSNKRKENTGNTAMLGKTAPVLMRACSAAVHLRVDISAQGRARTQEEKE